MAVESDLRAHLLDDSDVTALVSNRIYPLKAAASAASPFITYHKSKTTALGTIDDASKILRHTMVIEAWGATYASAKDVADYVIEALDGLSDTWSNGDVAIRFSNMSDAYDDEAALYTIKNEVTILQQES